MNLNICLVFHNIFINRFLLYVVVFFFFKTDFMIWIQKHKLADNGIFRFLSYTFSVAGFTATALKKKKKKKSFDGCAEASLSFLESLSLTGTGKQLPAAANVALHWLAPPPPSSEAPGSSCSLSLLRGLPADTSPFFPRPRESMRAPGRLSGGANGNAGVWRMDSFSFHFRTWHRAAFYFRPALSLSAAPALALRATPGQAVPELLLLFRT